MMDRYELPDPSLSRYDGGLAELRVWGEVRAYLGCRVSRLGLKGDGAAWPWFVVVWPDGTKEPRFEDYGPGWWTVRELDEGHFTHSSLPPVSRPVHWLGLNFGEVIESRGEEIDYEVVWLPADDARRLERELDISDKDF